MTPLGRRQGELLAQLRDLLILPSSSPTANKPQSAVGPGPLSGAVGAIAGPPPTPTAAAPSAMATGGRLHRRRGRSIKRGRDDDEVMTNVVEHHGEDPAAAARPRRDYSCKIRKKKQQSGGTSSTRVTSAPDVFDGYQWRKYGQKQIEGAMYPRFVDVGSIKSYYRCTRSAEQGCAAKRTVQRNDDGGAGAAAPKYTVVRVGEHTCTANDSPEAPVILETAAAAAAVPASNSSAAPTVSTTAGTESPAISDNTCSTITSSVSGCYMDDYYGGLFAAVHDNEWVPALASSSSPSSFPTIEDFAGPIRSPVHISAAEYGWTIDQLLLQLVNEPSHHMSPSV